MKKAIQLIAAMAVAICVMMPATAAQKDSKTTIVTQIYLAEIDCDACVKKIMAALPSQKGVKDVEVDLKKKLVTVQYDSGKSSDKDIIKAMTKLKIDSKVYEEPKQSSNSSNNNSSSNKR